MATPEVGTTATLIAGTMVTMAIVITVRNIEATATLRSIMAVVTVGHTTAAEDMVMVARA